MKKIGVTSYVEMSEACTERNFTNTTYTEAVRKSGALPVIIPVCKDLSLAELYMEDLDGLLIVGGCDVAPSTYGENPHPKVTEVSHLRDHFEIELIKAAVKKNVPIMGVCRGIQIINAAFGGNLIQHIPDEVPNAICHCQTTNTSDPIHTVDVKEDSLLFKAIGKKTMVNSYHHQACKKLGEGLKVAATAPDGVIEAIENPEKKIYAVQWHPEKMFDDYPDMAKIFKLFLDL